MSVDHYENFPVASIILPARLRHPVALIYRFARNADDFADEGTLSPTERLARLEEYRDELRRLEHDRPPMTALFQALAPVIREYALPMKLFHDLLDAFSQDVVKSRYRDFAELLDYCRRSADPVGRLLLRLFGDAEPENLARSDSICSALQLINFWQDVAGDYRRNRIYLPQEDLVRFGVTEAQIAAGYSGERWSELMRFQTARARAMLQSGAPLAARIPGRVGMELRMIVQGGLRIVEKIDRVGGDVYRHRPALRPWDWLVMLSRAAKTR